MNAVGAAHETKCVRQLVALDVSSDDNVRKSADVNVSICFCNQEKCNNLGSANNEAIKLSSNGILLFALLFSWKK